MKKILPFSIVAFVALFFTLQSCKPVDSGDSPGPSNVDSTGWIVNTDKFITYNTFISGTGKMLILSGASENGNQGNFSVTFQLPYVPAHDDYWINCENPKENTTCMEITYKGIRYRAKASNHDYLKADSANRKAKLILPLTWFYNTLIDNDSVAVSGRFIQP